MSMRMEGGHCHFPSLHVAGVPCVCRAIAQCPGMGGTLSLMLSQTQDGGGARAHRAPERDAGQESVQEEKGRAGEHPRENSSVGPRGSVSADGAR